MPIGLAIAGLALSALGTGASFAESARQARRQKEAEDAADAAVAKQKSLYSRDIYGGLQVPLEAYDRTFRESTAQQMQALQALSEADARTLAAGVGRVGMAANERDTRTRESMARDIYNLDFAKAAAEERRIGNMSNIYSKEAYGNQIMAAEAEKGKYQSLTSGFNALSSGLALADQEFTPLYPRTKTTDNIVTDSNAAISAGFRPESVIAPPEFIDMTKSI